jgi:hypothetical protein
MIEMTSHAEPTGLAWVFSLGFVRIVAYAWEPFLRKPVGRGNADPDHDPG